MLGVKSREKVRGVSLRVKRSVKADMNPFLHYGFGIRGKEAVLPIERR